MWFLAQLGMVGAVGSAVVSGEALLVSIVQSWLSVGPSQIVGKAVVNKVQQNKLPQHCSALCVRFFLCY